MLFFYKYFYFMLDNATTSSNQKLKVSLTSIQGDVALFTSFNNENPNDLSVVSSKRKRRGVSSVGSSSLGSVLALQANYTRVYIGVKGKSDLNSFKVEVKMLNSNSGSEMFNLIFILIICFECSCFYYLIVN